MIAMPWSGLRAALLAMFPALLVMSAGGLMTDQGPWFQQLAQPPWRPPGWLFGPVWLLILALTVASFACAWQRTGDAPAQRFLVAVFVLNAGLNVLWNVLFFQLRRPDLALVEILFLLVSIAAMMFAAGRQSQISWLLLVPYALWVSFAAMLNLEIVRLNVPLM